MKIISKYKDYYDYLSGIYGEDPKIVLDRRNHYNPIFYDHMTTILKLYICGWIIEGLFEKGKFYYGESLKEKGVKEKYRYFFNEGKRVSIKIDTSIISVQYEPYLDKEKLNIKENCPILIKEYGGLKKFPKLSELDIQQLYSPEEMYKMISNWLSDRITEKELTSDDVPDKQKIVNKGFDIKKSFRPKMKKK
ncbi:MAG: hypothetical protein ACOC2W_03250 [bacterium]